MRYVIDIDGVICKISTPFSECKPKWNIIRKINQLYKEGHRIILFTSRRHSDRKVTMKWLRKYIVKYHKLIMGKPLATYYVDDKNLSIRGFLK